MKPMNPALKVVLVTAGTAAALFLLPFFIRLFLPFLLAFLLALPCQRMVRFLERKLKINRGVSTVCIMALLVASVCGLAIFILYQLLIQARELISLIPQGLEHLKAQWTVWQSQLNVYFDRLSPEASGFLEKSGDYLLISLQNLARPLTDSAVGAAKDFAVSLPNTFLFLTMFLLATFFFTKDYTAVVNCIKELVPPRFVEKLRYLKNTVFHAFFQYIKAQAILMCITFAVASAALWAVGVDYPLVMGLIIGAVDALPFFGTGIILLPWAAFTFLEGNYFLTVSLVVIQIICQLIRQIMEPKIVSTQIGVHPLLTLIGVYAGFKLFGILGMILAPAAVMLAVNLYTHSRRAGKNM